MKVLVINAGSSSIKYQLYQMPQAQVLAKGMVERIKREGNPKIAAELLKEYKFWSKGNSEAVVLGNDDKVQPELCALSASGIR